MQSVSVTLILCHLLLISEPAFTLQKLEDMEATLVKRDTLIGNKGNNSGISVGMVYNIRQDGLIIGTAEVQVVKETMCGLKLIEIKPGHVPRVGDKLTFSDRPNAEQQSILAEMQKTQFNSDKLIKSEELNDASASDYYYAGQTAAENDFQSAFGGGFFAGLLGGLIGWGIGYAIISGQSADVPVRYSADVEGGNRLHFSAGYKKRIKSKKIKSFNAGALTGTLTAVGLVVYTLNAR